MDEQEEVLISELDEALLPEETETQEDFILATVAEVTATGVKIQIDGSESPGEKEYRVNSIQRLAVGDRVKICKNSGSYLIEYKIGSPMADYPLPKGGSDGQVLTKDGTGNYTVKWSDAVNPLPTGGSADQVLMKSSTVNYAVKWGDVPHELPTGGNDGQVLTKNGTGNYSVKWADAANPLPTGGSADQVLMKSSAVNYAVKWADVPHELPTGGTNGQCLVKNGATNYSVKWGSPSVDALVSGGYSVTLSNGALTPSTSTYGVSLGTTNARFNGAYINGNVFLAASTGTLGFFGSSGARRQTVANTATVATLITALKAYGLIY